MSRQGERKPPPGGHAKERAREFERRRGLSEGRDLDLEPEVEKEAGEGAEKPADQREEEARRDQST
jgi:hypothetical protein